MKLVALVRAPRDSEDAARALAEASGAALAEARMRLARKPPTLLARLEAARADKLVASLRRAGLAVLAVDAPCPSDRDRVTVHRFSLGDTCATLSSRSGESMRFRWSEVAAVLHGLRVSQTEIERTETRTSYLPMPDGFPVSVTTEDKVRTSSDSSEQVIFVYLRDGRRALLAASSLAFVCLGPAMQPSASGNMAVLARLFRERASTAFHDDRLLELGRRPLPFGIDEESRSGMASTVTTRSGTTRTLDILAEVMWRAVAEGLLP